MIDTVKGFGIVNKAEIDVFLELSCFFHDPADVGNLISGSSVRSSPGGSRDGVGVLGKNYLIRDSKGTFHAKMSTIRDRMVKH